MIFTNTLIDSAWLQLVQGKRTGTEPVTEQMNLQDRAEKNANMLAATSGLDTCTVKSSVLSATEVFDVPDPYYNGDRANECYERAGVTASLFFGKTLDKYGGRFFANKSQCVDFSWVVTLSCLKKKQAP